MKNKIFYLIFFLITSCGGCSSGLYQDILKAEELLNSQQFDKAIDVYTGILDKKPSKQIRIKIYHQLGDIYSIHKNEYQKSIKYFNKIIEDSNDFYWQKRAIQNMAKIFFENLGDFKQSKLFYDRLINTKPRLPKYNFYKFRYALSLVKLREYDEAHAVLDELILIDKNEYKVQSYFHKGLSYFYVHDWNNAIENWFEYLKYEKRKDKIINTKFLIANAYESSEKLKEAYNIYYSILGEYPNAEVVKTRLESLYKRRVSRKR